MFGHTRAEQAVFGPLCRGGGRDQRVDLLCRFSVIQSKVPPPSYESERDQRNWTLNRTVPADMEMKAVLFGFWGVAVPSSPNAVFASLEKKHNLPE